MLSCFNMAFESPFNRLSPLGQGASALGEFRCSYLDALAKVSDLRTMRFDGGSSFCRPEGALLRSSGRLFKSWEFGAQCFERC
jgi:hypothetical protein